MRIDFENIIDLSYPVDEDSPREGPIGPAKIYDTATMEEDGYFESRIDVSGHYSTHIDAPALMYADGAVVADLPIQRLMGEAVLMDFSHLNPGDEITKTLLEDWIQVSKVKNVYIEYSTTDYLDVNINGYKIHMRHKAIKQNKTASGRARFLGWSKIHDN